ncbi:uncharacterized protein AMSG_11698 [Thecamonas trahens ATCC 50062]|uniref:histidine kinase n=1 Tax=Thecamonas trahens ATCC 50062 TaxID=461836 RepID=A0A0L0DXC9_THETB|nr:hypothetical protein AMSG_11698 [Thecamonas trahens ATCC 50062]KNC56188.1 hypothetical protein AMSG_11698 [Thecamonas trahens ATCC 50062]|eukprot:XP_013761237.1 hypothetical protein AMSG_11698 [Thecamonas trahens ATCC 50062]
MFEAAKPGVDFSIRLPPAIPPALVADSGRIRQVLLNLASNAVKFTSSGSVSVDVALDALDPGTYLPGLPPQTADPAASQAFHPKPPDSAPRTATDDSVEWKRVVPAKLTFIVSDTGIGIAPDVVPRLFSPFVQADDSITRNFGGTGLGLAIVKEITSLCGGSVDLTSALDDGTTITASFVVGMVPSPEDQLARTLGDVSLLTSALTIVVGSCARLTEALLAPPISSKSVTTIADPLDALVALRDAPQPYDLIVIALDNVAAFLSPLTWYDAPALLADSRILCLVSNTALMTAADYAATSCLPSVDCLAVVNSAEPVVQLLTAALDLLGPSTKLNQSCSSDVDQTLHDLTPSYLALGSNVLLTDMSSYSGDNQLGTSPEQDMPAETPGLRCDVDFMPTSKLRLHRKSCTLHRWPLLFLPLLTLSYLVSRPKSGFGRLSTR